MRDHGTTLSHPMHCNHRRRIMPVWQANPKFTNGCGHAHMYAHRVRLGMSLVAVGACVKADRKMGRNPTNWRQCESDGQLDHALRLQDSAQRCNVQMCQCASTPSSLWVTCHLNPSFFISCVSVIAVSMDKSEPSTRLASQTTCCSFGDPTTIGRVRLVVLSVTRIRLHSDTTGRVPKL